MTLDDYFAAYDELRANTPPFRANGPCSIRFVNDEGPHDEKSAMVVCDRDGRVIMSGPAGLFRQIRDGAK